jgi:co-chaperonin GroES (HSP10)
MNLTGAIVPRDNLLVHVLASADTTDAGLAIPEAHADLPHQGVVLRAGKGKFADTGTGRLPMEYAIGDLVVFGFHAGLILPGHTNVRVMTESDVWLGFPVSVVPPVVKHPKGDVWHIEGQACAACRELAREQGQLSHAEWLDTQRSIMRGPGPVGDDEAR